MRSLPFLLCLIATGCVHHPQTQTTANRTQPALDPKQVIEAVGLKNITDSDFVAWTPRWDQVVLVGKSGPDHVAVVACRDGDSPAHWKLPVVEVRMVDGGRWIRGQWYYDHPPKRDEIEGLIRLLLHVEPTSGFTFRERF